MYRKMFKRCCFVDLKSLFIPTAKCTKYSDQTHMNLLLSFSFSVFQGLKFKGAAPIMSPLTDDPFIIVASSIGCKYFQRLVQVDPGRLRNLDLVFVA